MLDLINLTPRDRQGGPTSRNFDNKPLRMASKKLLIVWSYPSGCVRSVAPVPELKFPGSIISSSRGPRL